MSDILLELKDVTAGYARDIDVLTQINLRVHRGEIAGLIGLNGAGKSTLIKTICGFLTPKEGSVLFEGRNMSGIKPHQLIDHGICCIPQESSLFPFLNVEENLLLPIQSRRSLKNNSWQERYEEVLELFPILKEKRYQAAGELSGGQQKQLEFAKVWIIQPRLCLVDEPSIGLSPKIAEEVFVWLEKFTQDGMGVLLIDHNVRRVVEMSQNVYVLSLGKITASGNQEMFKNDLHGQVKEWLGLNY
ncbi:MAG: ABC transporter ATP-binding protein [Betaproteobacteria bacterium]|jgi:ABC-type branched-subunit amino acid transport system ATPase component